MSHVALDVSPEHVRWDVGACDLLWSNLLDLRYVIYGGRCGHETNCGTSFLDVSDSPDDTYWNIGACDRFWSHLSSLRYAMFGGGCHHGMYCGWLYSNVINTPEYIDWVVGACCDYAFSNSIGSFYGWVGLSAWYAVPYGGLDTMTISWVDGRVWDDVGAR